MGNGGRSTCEASPSPAPLTLTHPPSPIPYPLSPTGFPVLANRVAEPLVALAAVHGGADGGGEDALVEGAAHALDDLAVERLVGLQLAPGRPKLGMLLRRRLPLLQHARALRRLRLPPEAATGHDLRQPDPVAFRLVRRLPLGQRLEAVRLREDVE